MSRVAAVLHQDLDKLAELTVEDLLDLHEDARKLAGELAALRGF